MNQSSTGKELQQLDTLEDLPGPEDIEAGQSSSHSNALLTKLGKTAATNTHFGKFLRKRLTEKPTTRSMSRDDLNDDEKLELILGAVNDFESHYKKRKKQVTCGAACCTCFGAVLVALITTLGPTMAHLLTKEACD